MKKVFFIALMVPFFTTAQTSSKFEWGDETGIRFAQHLSWNDILTKAKAEHKYIFIDCFATWCGPCKVMSSEIFPLKEVGDFFNANFINVAVQMDSTANDSKSIQNWYADARELAKMYKIGAFPTYLFFSPDGNLVHRISGATQDADEFIGAGKNALDPSNQYYQVIRGIKDHKGDSSYLKKAFYMSTKALELEQADMIAEAYLKSLACPVTKENVFLLLDNKIVTSSHDRSFAFVLNNVVEIDSIIGEKDYAENTVICPIIFKELIGSAYRDESSPLRWKEICANIRQSYPQIGNTLLKYEKLKLGSCIEEELKRKSTSDSERSWDSTYTSFKRRYPGYDFVPHFLLGKIDYYERKGQWKKCTELAYNFLTQYRDYIGDSIANNTIWFDIFLVSGNQRMLQVALGWSKEEVARSPENPYFLDTYANLLYKLGNLRNALALENEAIAKARAQHLRKVIIVNMERNLDKMKSMRPTWTDSQPVLNAWASFTF